MMPCVLVFCQYEPLTIKCTHFVHGICISKSMNYLMQGVNRYFFSNKHKKLFGELSKMLYLHITWYDLLADKFCFVNIKYNSEWLRSVYFRIGKAFSTIGQIYKYWIEPLPLGAVVHFCKKKIFYLQLWASGNVVACVRVCVRLSQIQVCPRDNLSPVQARMTKFGSEVQDTLVKICIVLGMTFKVKLNLIVKTYHILSLWVFMYDKSPPIEVGISKFRPKCI